MRGRRGEPPARTEPDRAAVGVEHPGGQRLGGHRRRRRGGPRTRLWQLYFALFGLGFERCLCGNFQTLASKRQPGPSGLPLSGRPGA